MGGLSPTERTPIIMPHRDPRDELQDLLTSDPLNPGAVAEFVRSLDPKEQVHAADALPSLLRDTLLATLPPEDAARLVAVMPDVQAAEVIEHLEPRVAAAIVANLPSDEQADVINQLEEGAADQVLAAMPLSEAEQIRALAKYDLDQAGGLMVTEFLAFNEAATVAEVVHDLRNNADTYRDLDVQYAYVTDDRDHLVGVLILRELLLQPNDKPIRDISVRNPLTIRDDERLDEIQTFFDQHTFVGAPVVDRANVLLGVLNRAEVEHAAAERSEGDYRKALGIVGGEELRSMPIRVRSRRRLAWLSINIVLNIMAASVIAVNQDVLNQVIVLAVFLPIISDMSGCSGNQAVAVSMRELSLGVAKPADIFRVLGKEAAVGAINGLALGLLIGLVAGLWQGNLYLSLVVGVAMAINTVVAVCIGGCVPLLLKGLDKDPALASGPILTTITDMCGFFLVLTLASLAIERLPSDDDAEAEQGVEEVEEAADIAGDETAARLMPTWGDDEFIGSFARLHSSASRA